MFKTILLCLTALAIISRADPTFADCSNEVRSSLSLISQFDQDLINKNLTQIRADFALLQTLANSINKACDHMIHIGGTVPSPEITTCDGIIEDLRNNVHKFVTNNQKYDFDTVQMLGYLTSKSLLFATLCPAETEQKPALVMTRILNTLDLYPQESLLPEKIEAPTPECLSQVYQALSTLYSFEADVSDQDISDMASDYEALREVSKNLNNFCTPEIVLDTNNTDDSKDCDATLQNIGNILSGVSPTDANNVIATIQGLWNEYPGFKENCRKKREEVKVDKYRKGVEAIEDVISTASEVRELNDLKKLAKKVGTILTMLRG